MWYGAESHTSYTISEKMHFLHSVQKRPGKATEPSFKKFFIDSVLCAIPDGRVELASRYERSRAAECGSESITHFSNDEPGSRLAAVASAWGKAISDFHFAN
jgi:hypothetical protein